MSTPLFKIVKEHSEMEVKIIKLERRIGELEEFLSLARKAHEALQSGDKETYNSSAKYIGKFLASHSEEG